MRLPWPIAALLGLLPVAVLAAAALSIQHGAAAARSAELTPAGWAAMRASLPIELRLNHGRIGSSASLRSQCGSIPRGSGYVAAADIAQGCYSSADMLQASEVIRGCIQGPKGAPERACLAPGLHDLSASLTDGISLDAAIAATLLPGRCRTEVTAGDADAQRLATASDEFAQSLPTAETVSDVAGPLQDWEAALQASQHAGQDDATEISATNSCRPSRT